MLAPLDDQHAEEALWDVFTGRGEPPQLWEYDTELPPVGATLGSWCESNKDYIPPPPSHGPAETQVIGGGIDEIKDICEKALLGKNITL